MFSQSKELQRNPWMTSLANSLQLNKTRRLRKLMGSLFMTNLWQNMISQSTPQMGSLYMTSPMQNMTGQFTMLRRFLHMTSLKQSKIIQTPLLMRFLNKTSPKQSMTTQSKLQMWILHTTSLQLLIPQTMDYLEGATEGARRSLHALILRIFRRNKSTKLYFVNL